MFEAGDKVRVVKGHGSQLPEGEVFTVNHVSSDKFVFLEDHTPSGGWIPNRFELVEERDMATDYPTDLETGDRLKTSTGREYIVAKVSNGRVYYVYIPAKYDNKSNKRLALDSRRVEDLKWVDKVVDSNGNHKWPKVRYEIGTLVVGRLSGRKGIVVSSDPLKVWWEGLDHSIKELPSFIEEA